MEYTVPPINSKGKFVLAAPFDNVLSSLEEYLVTAIRSLDELASDKPYDNIYKPVGLTEEDLARDLENKVPIVVLLSTGNEYLYVPANRILSIPVIVGKQHQEKMLAISLGLLPLDLDLTTLEDDIASVIYDSLGVEAVLREIPTSAKVLLDDATSKQMELLRENKSSVKKSFRTRYQETLTLLNKKDTHIRNLESYIKKIKCNC